MKRSILLFVILTTNYFQIFSQTNFGGQHIISTGTDGPNSVYAIDIDNDGDMDVLSASFDDDKISWYENTDGQGDFQIQHVISTSADGGHSVNACDIDGDGDNDVLSASFFDSKIAWYENTDGLGSFGAQQIITTDANEAKSVCAVDVDGDGDMDVLSASFGDMKIAWYENTDGLGSFGAQQVISTNADGARKVFAIDIDGDEDMDILSASFWDDKIAWYENTDGKGSFGTQQIITTNTDGAGSVFAIDIDGDNDIDVLSASSSDNKIAWYENTDGKGSFGTQQVITTQAGSAQSVFASDADSDGDIDVFSASSSDNKIAWYENTDGKGSFGTQQIITVEAVRAWSVYACDVDNDGNMDVVSASSDDNKIAWYKNIGASSGFENTESFNISFNIYPNPTEEFVEIELMDENVSAQIEIYDIYGRKMKNYYLTQINNHINISDFLSGIYILKISVENQEIVKQIIKK